MKILSFKTLRDSTWKYKKSVRACISARPTIRGSGLPIPVNEQLQSPHAKYDTMDAPIVHPYSYLKCGASIVACHLTGILKLPDF